MSEKYNGWTNYETWCVNLWISNEQGTQRYWQAEAQDCWDNAEASPTWTREENATFELTDALKERFDENKNDILEQANSECSVWADLLNSAFNEVNWREIAEHYIAEVDKSAEEETEEV